jgi:soluble calcium-activated nucleotidase 1
MLNAGQPAQRTAVGMSGMGESNGELAGIIHRMGSSKEHAAPSLGGQLRIFAARVAAAWGARPAYERRAVLFVLVFVLLVGLSVWSAVDAAAPVGGQVGGILPNIGGFGGHTGILVADVNNFAVTAVADNDGVSGPAGASNSASEKLRKEIGAPPGAPTPSTALVTGKLSFDPRTQQWSIEWSPTPQYVTGMITVGGRGMELGTLQYWRDGKLYSCDDRSGIVYELIVQEGSEPQAIPRYIVPDGNGNAARGMRCEWATIKGDFMMLGSTGRPRTDIKSNLIVNSDALWVKAISPLGEVRHLDWTEPYAKLRAALGIVRGNGYVVHECAAWSRVRRQWVFVPRHVSSTPYDPADERKHGSTVIVITDSNFATTRVVALPPMRSSSTPFGVTECKFIPNGKDDALLLVKAITRDDGTYESVVAIVRIDGQLIMDDRPMPPGWKFEALELRPLLHSE